MYLIIKKERIHSDDAHRDEAWDMITTWVNKSSIRMAGFSDREVEICIKNDDILIFKMDKTLVDSFTLFLCEASSIDFTYTIMMSLESIREGC